MAVFSFGLIAQNQNIEDRIEKIKSQHLKSGYEPWGLCFVEGIPKTQNITDSINRFSILVPSGYNLNILERDGFRIMQFESNKGASESNIVMKVWVKPNDKIRLGDIFDQAIDSHVKNKIPFRIGTENINGEPTYWMETYNSKKDKLWELTFYIKHPSTESTILVKQKSFRKKKYHQDFCVYGFLIRSLKWL